jgi:tyrosine-protein kinase Etk/Wzc
MMNAQNSDVSSPEAGIAGGKRRGDVLDYVLAVLRWRRFILVFVGCVTVGALVVSFLLPRWYRSTATLIPPKESDTFGGLGGLSSLLKEVAPGAGAKLGGQSASYNYLAILKSRKAAEAVIRRFELLKVYDIPEREMERAVKAFSANFGVEVTNEGTLVIEVFDRDSLRAADMTNFIVETLNQISVDLGKGEARSNREFLEGRVAETREDLKVAEDRFRDFQQEHGMVILPDDVKSSAASLGDLYARKLKTELQLALLKRSTGIDNPAYTQLQMENEEIGKQLARFPDLGVESFRLYRNMLIQQKVLEFLIPLYEQARVEEHRDIPVMLVLDRGVPAERKAYPQRMLIVAVAFLSSLLVAIAWVLIVIRLRIFRADHPDRYRELMAELRVGGRSR